MEDKLEFFVVALPGLEDIVQAEIAEWYPDLKSEVQHGGVTVYAPLRTGLALNLALKTATRILVRVDEFRARDFPKLYNKIAKYPWRELIDPSVEMTVHVATRLSRLKIKKRTEETCSEAFSDYRREQKVTIERGRKASMFVRLIEDECTVSLDTSGERLHKRGSRQHIGEAPLRETIAAALIQQIGRKHAALDPREVEIIDPMMGSGTFLLEAAIRDELIDGREFAFENFATKKVDKPSLKTKRPNISKMTGFEIDAKTIAAARSNIKAESQRADFEIFEKDFFKADPLPEAEGRQRWLFCNPPYGERIKVKEPLTDLYIRLFQAAERVAKPDIACFILPNKVVKGRFPLPAGWKVIEKRPFLNGGIPVVTFVFGRTT